MRVVGDVLFALVLAVAAFALVLSVSSKKSTDGTANLFGYELRFVQSDSMEKCAETDVSDFKVKSIRVKSCVFIKTAPKDETKLDEWYRSLKVGDVLTFKYVYTKQETITHRIVQIAEKPTGGYLITLQGDNRAEESGLLSQTIDTSLTDSPNYIIGKVTGQSYALGLFVYALRSPVGLICLIIIPCAIIILFEILRIVHVFGKDKKERETAQAEAQANEIEELKRQLALLQEQTAATNDTPCLSQNCEVDKSIKEE